MGQAKSDGTRSKYIATDKVTRAPVTGPRHDMARTSFLDWILVQFGLVYFGQKANYRL